MASSLRPQNSFIVLAHSPKETSYGKPVADASITNLYPMAEPMLAEVAIERVYDSEYIKGHEFAADQAQQKQITKDYTVPVNAPASTELAGMLFANAMGTVNTTGSGDPYTHVITAKDSGVSDQCPSTSMVVGVRGQTATYKKYSGAIPNEVRLSVEGRGRAMLSASYFTDGTERDASAFSIPGSLATTTPLFGKQAKFLACDAGGTLVDYSHLLQSFEISWNNNLSREDARTLVAKSRYAFEVGLDAPSVYYRMDEKSGTVMLDASGNGVNGVYANTPTLGAAGALTNDPNTAVTFASASTEAATVADNALLDPGDTFTLEIWAKPVDFSATQVLFDKGDNGYAVYLDTGGLVNLIKKNVGGIAASTTGCTAATWNHIVVTKATSTVKIYINGADVTGSVTNETIEATTSSLFIAQNADDGQNFNGTLDEAAIYPTALSAARVKDHYTAASGMWRDSLTALRFGNRQVQCKFKIWGSKGDAFYSSDFLSDTLKWVRFSLTNTVNDSITFDFDRCLFMNVKDSFADIRNVLEIDLMPFTTTASGVSPMTVTVVNGVAAYLA